MNTNVEVIKDIDESDAEPAFYSVVDGNKSQKGNATYNYSARKKIEEYLENKILIKLTCDTFDDIG